MPYLLLWKSQQHLWKHLAGPPLKDKNKDKVISGLEMSSIICNQIIPGPAVPQNLSLRRCLQLIWNIPDAIEYERYQQSIWIEDTISNIATICQVLRLDNCSFRLSRPVETLSKLKPLLKNMAAIVTMRWPFLIAMWAFSWLCNAMMQCGHYPDDIQRPAYL